MARVLVVDDDSDINMCVAVGAQNGWLRGGRGDDRQRGSAACSAPAPDLVLLDLMLPDIDGLEVCRRLRAAPATARVPIVFLTARTDEATRVRGLAPAPTTTSSSRSARRSCCCASAPCCGARRRSRCAAAALGPAARPVSRLERLRRDSPRARRVARLPRGVPQHPAQLRRGAHRGRAHAALRAAVGLRAAPRRRGSEAGRSSRAARDPARAMQSARASHDPRSRRRRSASPSRRRFAVTSGIVGTL